jgi:hypothetical protein
MLFSSFEWASLVFATLGFIFIYMLSPAPKFWDSWGASPHTRKTLASTAALTWFMGTKITGSVADCENLDGKHYRITVNGSKEIEELDADKLVPLRKDKAITHSPDDVWVNSDATSEAVLDEMKGTVGTLKARVKAAELGRLGLEEDMVDIRGKMEEKVKKEAQFVGVVRREGSTNSGFTPYGSSYGRRPYYYGAGGQTGLGGGGGGED